MDKNNRPIASGVGDHFIRLLGSGDTGSPINAKTIYNLLFGKNPGWLVIRVSNGTLITIAPDGTPLEVCLK